jgi:putative transposase
VNRSKFTKEEVSVNDYKSLNHTTWDCKFHVVWIPKYRRKALYGQIRKQLVPVLKELARQKESEIVEGHLVTDHVHMLISIPPKYAVAQVIGFLKGKSAIWISRMCGRQRNFIGQNFWARGYCVSTIGLDEDVVRDYIKRQEDEDKKLDQLKMFEE